MVLPQKPSRKKINGLAAFVGLLTAVDPVTRKKWLEAVREKQPWLSRIYDKFSFQFDDLVRLDDRSIQKLFASIDEKTMLLAWKLASDNVKEHFLKNMSTSRRADFLVEFESASKIHKREVFKAQQHICEIAKAQLELGKFSFRNKVKRLR